MESDFHEAVEMGRGRTSIFISAADGCPTRTVVSAFGSDGDYIVRPFIKFQNLKQS